jgi:DNA-binding CsgD family transcriptional regulator
MTTAEPLALGQLGTLVASVTSRLLGADAAGLLVWQEGGRRLELVGHNDPGATSPPYRGSPGEGATGAAFEAGRPLLVSDYRRSRHAVPIGTRWGVRGVVAAPILVGERRVGVLAAWAYRAGRWTPEHPRLLWLVSSVIATAVATAQHRASSTAAHLTPRETQVLGDMMAGIPARSIAQRQRLSEATVRTHIRSVLTKLGASSQLAAVARARELGLGPS